MNSVKTYSRRPSTWQLLRDRFDDFSKKELSIHPHISWEPNSPEKSLHTPKYDQHLLFRRYDESRTCQHLLL
jgi:hypothetical protein